MIIPRVFRIVAIVGGTTCCVACGSATVPSAPSLNPVPAVSSAPAPIPGEHVTLAGTVTEVRGTTIAGANVRTADGSVATVTNQTGAFQVADFPSQPLIVSGEGYESLDVPRYLSSHTDLIVRLQREIRVVIGDTAVAILFRDDPVYGSSGVPDAGPSCLCKRLLVLVPQAGSVDIMLTSAGPLSLWIGDVWPSHPADAPIRVNVQAGELVLYVGADWVDGPELGDATPFHLTTRFIRTPS
jgi:hypothetical protein